MISRKVFFFSFSINFFFSIVAKDLLAEERSMRVPNFQQWNIPHVPTFKEVLKQFENVFEDTESDFVSPFFADPRMTIWTQEFRAGNKVTLIVW